jgi:integrase
MSTRKIKGSEGWRVSLSLRIGGKRYRRERLAKGYFNEATNEWIRPQKHAKQLEAELMKEIEDEARGKEPEPKDDILTIGQIMKMYFDNNYLLLSGNSRSTAQSRVAHFAAFCKRDGIIYAHQVTEAKAEEFWKFLKANFKGSGPYGKYEATSALLNWAIKKKLPHVVNTLPSVKREPEEKSEQERWIEDDLLDALLDAALHGPEDAKLSYDILVDCGLRRDELRNLPKVRIDLKREQLRVAAFSNWKPKTPRSRRWVPMTDRAIRAVMRLMEKYPDSVFLIPSSRIDKIANEPRGENWLQNQFDQLREETIKRHPWTRPALREKIGDTGKYAITLHSFRHTYASLLLQAGFSSRMIGDLMGHSETYVTERYAKFAKTDFKATAAHLNSRELKRYGTEAGTGTILKMANLG